MISPNPTAIAIANRVPKRLAISRLPRLAAIPNLKTMFDVAATRMTFQPVD
jgi:hypothetical protein